MSWSDARHAAWLPLDAVKCDQASNGCSRGLPSLRRVCGDDLVHRALADACGRPAQRARAAGHALDIVQHHFVARRVHRRRRAGLACCVSRDRAKIPVYYTTLDERAVARVRAWRLDELLFCVVFRCEDVNRQRLGSARPNTDARRSAATGSRPGCPGQAGGRPGT